MTIRTYADLKNVVSFQINAVPLPAPPPPTTTIAVADDESGAEMEWDIRFDGADTITITGIRFSGPPAWSACRGWDRLNTLARFRAEAWASEEKLRSSLSRLSGARFTLSETHE